MKITKQELIDTDVGKDMLRRFMRQTNDSDEPVDVASLVGGCNTYDDMLWLACKKLPRDRVVKLACDCALLNIELIKPYTNSYDTIVQFLKKPDFDAAVARESRAAYITCTERVASRMYKIPSLVGDVIFNPTFTVIALCFLVGWISIGDLNLLTAVTIGTAITAAEWARSRCDRVICAAISVASAVKTDRAYAGFMASLSRAVVHASRVDGKEKVNQLLIDMFNEVE